MDDAVLEDVDLEKVVRRCSGRKESSSAAG